MAQADVEQGVGCENIPLMSQTSLPKKKEWFKIIFVICYIIGFIGFITLSVVAYQHSCIEIVEWEKDFDVHFHGIITKMIVNQYDQNNNDDAQSSCNIFYQFDVNGTSYGNEFQIDCYRFIGMNIIQVWYKNGNPECNIPHEYVSSATQIFNGSCTNYASKALWISRIWLSVYLLSLLTAIGMMFYPVFVFLH